MSRKMNELEREVLELPTEDRALLAEHIIASLDTGQPEDVEELWLQEAEQRYQAYRAGKLTLKPATQTFQEAASRLK
ncbi:MAG: addiction module protein [Gammaproteobacteria bacterium]|nr:addiction module protein [Gammaproteobacteria bacterium]